MDSHPGWRSCTLNDGSSTSESDLPAPRASGALQPVVKFICLLVSSKGVVAMLTRTEASQASEANSSFVTFRINKQVAGLSDYQITNREGSARSSNTERITGLLSQARHLACDMLENRSPRMKTQALSGHRNLTKQCLNSAGWERTC